MARPRRVDGAKVAGRKIRGDKSMPDKIAARNMRVVPVDEDAIPFNLRHIHPDQAEVLGLVTGAQFTEASGYSRSAFYHWRHEHSDFPSPVGVRAKVGNSGPAYYYRAAELIAWWCAGRKSGRIYPPRKK